MDLFSIIGATLRRWYVTVPIVVLAGLVSWQAYHAVEPVYSSTVSISVLPPVEPADAAEGEEPDNPYSGAGGAQFAALVLARNLNGTAFQESIGLDEDSTASIDASASDREPIIRITATASTPEETLQLLDQVTVSANTVLDEFQAEAGAADEARFRTALAVPADQVEDVTPSRLRTSGALAVVGLGLAAALATALDMGLEARGRRGRGTRPTSEGPSTEGPHDPEAEGPTSIAARPAEPAPVDDDDLGRGDGHEPAPAGGNEPAPGEGDTPRGSREDAGTASAATVPPTSTSGSSRGEVRGQQTRSSPTGDLVIVTPKR